MRMYIKNMVCSRCKMVVKAEVEKAGLQTASVELGEVELKSEPTKSQLQQLNTALKSLGFELLDDRKSQIISKIKSFIIDAIHHKEEQPNKNYSELISQHLHHDYSYLSNLFSGVEGITIEHFIINQKIEKVKELLMYGELSLNEVADQLGYSSVAHLSNQFKKITGLTPGHFKKVGQHKRKSLDQI